MGRPFICKIVGRGTPNEPYRPFVDGLAGVTAWKACIASNPDGKPFLPWAIVLVEATDYAAIAALPECIPFPVAALDNALTLAQRTFIENKAGGLGYDITIPVGTTLRQLLRALVKRHYAHADENEVLS